MLNSRQNWSGSVKIGTADAFLGSTSPDHVAVPQMCGLSMDLAPLIAADNLLPVHTGMGFSNLHLRGGSILDATQLAALDTDVALQSQFPGSHFVTSSCTNGCKYFCEIEL